MKSVGRSTTVWMVLLAIAAVALTVVTFFSLIIPEYRKATFYQVVVGICLAEVIFFGFLGYLLSAAQRGNDPAHAVRLRTMSLVTVWFLFVSVSGAFAVMPRYADSLYSDKILIWQMLLTFAVLAWAFFFSRQQAVLEEKSTEPERQRAQVQSYALGTDTLLAELRRLGGRRPAKAVELDRLTKRVDTLRSELQGAFPRTERAAGQLVDPAPLERIEGSLRGLHDQVERLDQVSEGQLDQELERAHRLVDDAIAAVRQRQKALTF